MRSTASWSSSSSGGQHDGELHEAPGPYAQCKEDQESNLCYRVILVGIEKFNNIRRRANVDQEQLAELIPG